MSRLDEQFIDVNQDDSKRLMLLAKATSRLRQMSILAYISSLVFGIVIITDRSGASRQIMAAVITLVLWMIVLKIDSDIKLVKIVDKLIASNRNQIKNEESEGSK